MMFVTMAVYSATTRVDCFMSRQLKRSAPTETRVLSPAKKRREERAHSQNCRKMKRGLLVNFARSAFGVRCVLASLSWFAPKPVCETIRKWRDEPRATHNLKRR